MKRGIAALLRYRSSWQLVWIAAITTGVALWMSYGLYQSTLRQLKPLLIILFGTAGAALILAFVRRGEEITEGRARGFSPLVAGIVGLAAALAFVTYSVGVDMHRSQGRCNGARLPETLSERRAALEAAEANLRSPFALLHQRVNGAATRDCAEARADFDRLAQGLCTEWPLVDQSCRCGDETFPYARCAEPRCLTQEGWPDLFYCVGDDVPAGRSL
jgi:hypothetical protein